MEEKLIPKDLPAGYKREEAKRVVKDQLEEKAEKLSAEGPYVGSFDPSKIEPENEIAQHFNQYLNTFEVVDAQPDYCYLWCHDSHRSITEALTRAQRFLGNHAKGYEIVKGDDPECKHLRDVNGYRRIGDVILLRIDKDTYFRLKERIEQLNKARERGSASLLLQQAMRHPRYVKAREFEGIDPREFYRARAEAGGRVPDDALVHDMMTRIGEDAKKGSIKGMPLERAIHS